MITSPADTWDKVRQSFADQFEQDGANFIYRKSQKGEAIRVTAEERRRFFDEFDRNVRRAKWIIYIGMTVVLGAVILMSVLTGSELSEAAIVAGIGLVMVPYFVYYRWVWAAPSRELAGRTPIAGERSSEEVRRLQFQRLTYGQLASAAAGGLLIPFIGSSHHHAFEGWNRLWLIFGGALVLVAAVQAFRKWRFEQEYSYTGVVPRSFHRDFPGPLEDGPPPSKGRLPRYVLFGGALLAVAFIAFTPLGKRLAQLPAFWAIVMTGCGGWSLFTVARGFAKGQIEPFARGFYNTYRRETQPKAFWASMCWNACFGCFALWAAFGMTQQWSPEVQDQCYRGSEVYSTQEQLRACNKLINDRDKSDDDRADLFVARGITYERLKDYRHAVADYTTAIQLNPKNAYAHYDRGLVYQQFGDLGHAIADFNQAIRLHPKGPEAILHRGSAYQGVRDLDRALSDFNEVIRLRPDRPEGYEYRGWVYRDLGDEARAEADLAVAARLKASANSPLS